MGCYKCQNTGFHDGQICECITGKKEPPTVEGAVEMLKRMFGMEGEVVTEKRGGEKNG